VLSRTDLYFKNQSLSYVYCANIIANNNGVHSKKDKEIVTLGI